MSQNRFGRVARNSLVPVWREISEEDDVDEAADDERCPEDDDGQLEELEQTLAPVLEDAGQAEEPVGTVPEMIWVLHFYSIQK